MENMHSSISPDFRVIKDGKLVKVGSIVSGSATKPLASPIRAIRVVGLIDGQPLDRRFVCK